MAIPCLLLFALYAAWAFGVQSVLHFARTGSSGFRGLSGRPGSPEWTGGALLVAALGLAVAAPLLAVAGVVPATSPSRPVAGVGLALYVLGFAGTVWSQRAMGDSWRIGVQPTERTTLVTGAPFRRVRNPIYTSMVIVAAGLFLVLPGLLTALAVVTLVAGVELHVRRVEEPYLLGTHGATYARYAARTGRFVPGVGRLHSAT